MADNSPLAKKIRELLKKKEEKHAELKKIEEILQREDEEIRQQLEETVREIREEEEEKFKEVHETNDNRDLERTVEEEHPEPAPSTESNVSYVTSDMLQEGNVNVYDLATQGVYDKVTDILNTPAQFRTNEERNFLKGVTYHVDKIQRKEMYITEKDPNDFLKRTQNVISSFYK